MSVTRPASLAALAALTLAALFAASPALADDWPSFRGPNHNGISTETGWTTDWPASGPKVAWTASVGTGASSFAVVGNRALTIGNSRNRDTVTCFNLETGEVMWSFEYAQSLGERNFEGGPASTPTVDGDTVYTLSHLGDLHALKLSDGSLIWKKNLVNDFGGRFSSWKYAGSPLVIDNMVIVDTGSATKSTVALDKITGRELWAAGSDPAGYATPYPFTQGNTPAVLVFKGKAMVALNRTNGRELWRIGWETSYDVNASNPTIVGDKLFISSGYPANSGRLAAYQLGNGQPRRLWENQDIETKMNSVTVYNGSIYAISEHQRGKLVSIDPDTGRENWIERSFGQYGTLMIADGKLVIFDDDGELVIADASPAGYNELARTKVLEGTCWVQPVLANGHILVKNNSGEVVCFEVTGASAN